MVLSVFAMSVSFAGAAAAEATDVTIEDKDPADDEVNINVSHADGDSNVYAIITSDNTYGQGDILVENTTAEGNNTTLTADVSNLSEGSYTAYAFAGTDDSVLPTEGGSGAIDGPAASFNVSSPETPSVENYELTVSVSGLNDGNSATVTVTNSTGAEVNSTSDVTDSTAFNLSNGTYTVESSADGLVPPPRKSRSMVATNPLISH